MRRGNGGKDRPGRSPARAPRRGGPPAAASVAGSLQPAIALGLGLLVLTVIAYLPALQGGFIWDDDDYVTKNQTLRSIDGLRRIWLEPGAVPQYYPLTFSSLWTEYQLWGPRPGGYHLTNVLLHASAAILLWRALVQLALPGAWLAAALFALHPMNVESVAWITERKNVLSAVLYLAAALAYLRFAFPARGEIGRPWLYALATACFLGALLSKTVACSLPVTLGLLVWWKRGRLTARDGATLLPWLAMGLALALVTVWMEKHHVGATGADWSLSLVERALVAGRALWFYAGKLVWPHPLIFIYPRWRVDAGMWWQYLFPLAAAAVPFAFYALRQRIGWGPLVAVAIYAITLAPALGFIDVYPMRYSFVADHFAYHASMGLIALGAAAMVSRRADLGSAAVPAAVVLLGTLGVLTWRQGYVYRDLHTLWADVLAKNPDCSMAHINAGMVSYQAGRAGDAVAHFRQAIRIDPRDADAHDNLGMALAALGRIEEAMAAAAEALRLDPADAGTHNNLGNLLARQSRLDEAIAAYGEAVRLKPGYPDARSNLGNALALQGRAEEAIVQYRAALRLDPGFAEAHYNLAVVLAGRNELSEALAHYDAAARARPGYAEAHQGAADTLAALGRNEEAAARHRTALRLRSANQQPAGGR
jgi:tetratricopeptide (TPR) repeat protein